MRYLVFLLLASLGVPAADLELSVIDSATRRPVAARVYIRDSDGKEYLPDGAVKVPIGPDRWFVASGRVRVAVPAPAVRVHVERGTEYEPLVLMLDIPREGAVQRQIGLRRWISMRERGYQSGEDHLHVAAAELGAMLAAEDLNFGTSFHWWNRPHLALPRGARAVMDLAFANESRQASLFDAEVETAWGAVYLIGLPAPVSIPGNRRRANLAYVKAAREQGGLICYQGGWSRESLVDALLGYVDVVNVCNNNFHRFKYQPRRIYSNLLETPGLPEYPDTAEGMMQMNTDTYYRMLNCGLRLAAGAGSATGAKATPAGYNRSYVHTGGKATLKQFLDEWRKGRNFVTNGPMVFLTADKNREPGDDIALGPGGGKIRLKATAVSDQPLRTLEIVRNGAVVGKAKVSPNSRQTELSLSLEVREGSWIAARATAEDGLLSDAELSRYVRRTGRPDEPTRLRFGHTSPIYVTVGGAGARVRQSIEEARRMLAAFERFARKEADDAYRDEILAVLPLAVEKLGR